MHYYSYYISSMWSEIAKYSHKVKLSKVQLLLYTLNPVYNARMECMYVVIVFL